MKPTKLLPIIFITLFIIGINQKTYSQANAGEDQEICTDTTTLHATNPFPETGYWTVVNGGAIFENATLYNTKVSNLAPGLNTIRWTVGGEYDDVEITNNYVTVYAGENDTICSDSKIMNAEQPGSGNTGYWALVSGAGTPTTPSAYNTEITGLGKGNNIFSWTITRDGCSGTSQVGIYNALPSEAIISNVDADFEYEMGEYFYPETCDGTVTLTAVNPTIGTGYWEETAGLGLVGTTTVNPVYVTGLAANNNEFTWTIYNTVGNTTCASYIDTAIVNNYVVAEAGENDITCENQMQLHATPLWTGDDYHYWTNMSGGDITIDSWTDNETWVRNLPEGTSTFKWNVGKGNCVFEDIVEITYVSLFADAGADQVLCKDTTTLEAQTIPYATSQYWEIITGTPTITNSTDPNSEIILEQGTSTVLKWTVVKNGCSDEDFVIIQNKNITAVAYDNEVCNSTTTLNAVPAEIGYYGYWTNATAGIIYSPDNSTHNATVTGLVEGANQFTWHVYNEYCEDSTSTTISYLIPFASAGPSVPICADYHTLTANNPSIFDGTGKWTVVSGHGNFVNDTYYGTVVNNLGQGENKFRWTVYLRDCENSDIVTITNNKPTISVGATQNICQDNTVLTGNPLDAGDEGIWTPVTQGTHVIVNPTEYDSQVTGLEPGTAIFEWTVSNEYCEASEQLIINNISIIADAGENQIVCVDSVQLSANLPEGATGIWTSPVPGPQILNNTAINTWVTNLNNGNNLFSWTVYKDGCEDTDYVIVDNSQVFANAGDDQNICAGFTTLYGNSTDDDEFGYWEIISGAGFISNPSSNITTVTNIGVGTNVFRWNINNETCSGHDDVVVTYTEILADAGLGDEALCDSIFELNAVPAEEGTTGIWTIVGGAGNILNETDANTMVTNLAKGENILWWYVTSIQYPECYKVSEIIVNNITPTYAITAPDREICENTTTITANNAVYDTGLWTVITGSGIIENNSLYSTIVNNLGAGANKIEWRITSEDGTCSTSDTITIINSSTTAHAGLDRETCVDTFKLEAAEPSFGIGIWSKVSGEGIILTPTIYNSIVELSEGDNTFAWTVTEGICSASKEVVITNNKPTTSWAGDDDLSCTGSYTLEANTPDLDESGLWSSIGGVYSDEIVTPTSYYTDVNNLTNGDNIFIWEISKGLCSDKDTVIITNNKINVDVIAPSEICADTALIRGNIVIFDENTSANWSVVGGSGTFDDATNYQTVVRGMEIGANTYRWTIIDGECSNYADVQIANNQVFANAGEDQTICTNHTTLSANDPSLQNATGYWAFWAGGGDFITNSLYNTEVINIQEGNNDLRWIVTKGECSDYDHLQITNATQTAIAAPDHIVCENYSTITANNPEYGVGVWSLLGGGGVIENPTLNSTQVTELAQGNNTFRWTVTNGDCVEWDEIIVTNNEIIPQTGNVETCDTTAFISFAPLEGSTGLWNIIGGTGNFTNQTSASTVVNGLNEGLNTLTWTVYKNGCSAINIMRVYNNMIYTNAGDDQLVVTDYAEMNALDIETGQIASWSVIAGSGNFGTGVANNNATVTDLAYGANTFRWYVHDNDTGCEANDDVEIFRTVNAGGDITLEGDTIYLNAVLPEGAIGEWTIMYGAAVIEDINDPNTKAWDLAMGLNTFRWTVTFPDKGDKGLVLWDEVNVDRILEINDLENTQTIIFPNPSNGIINIISEKEFEKSDIYIYNITGSLVAFETLEKSPNKLIIQLKENKAGIYFIKINTQNSVIVEKIIVK